MIKQILSIIKTILENKYVMAIGTQIWHEIDENFRISETVEEIVQSKSEQFIEKMKEYFPNMTDDKIKSIEQSIGGVINAGKSATVDTAQVILDLQEKNTDLQNQINKLQSVIASAAAVTESTSTDTATAQ